MVHVAGAWTSTAVLGRPADRLARSNQRRYCGRWFECEFGASAIHGPAGAALLACGQKFALNLKQAGFDRAGTPKSPQQAC